MKTKNHAESAVETKQVFKLGYFLFTLTHCKPDFTEALGKLLPLASAEEALYPEVYPLNMNCTEDPRGLFNDVLRRHYKSLWVDAACLITPSGKKVLLCGPVGAGKSTLAVALALGFNWTVVSEDVTLVDPASDQLLNFAAPFLLNKNSLEMVQQAIGKVPAEMILDQWAPLHGLANQQSHHAPFDVAIYFDTPKTALSLETTSLSVGELLPKLLPISNLGRKNGVDKFASYLPETKCYSLSGGTLNERLTAALELCGESADVSSEESTATLVGNQTNMKDSVQTYKYLRAEHTVCALQADGNCVIAGKRDDLALVLGPAAALVWEFCDGQHTVGEMMDELHGLGVPVEFDQTQISELIDELSKEGLISRV